MKFKVLKSRRIADVDLTKYLVDWDAKVSRGGKKNFGAFQYNVKQLLKPHWKDCIVVEEFSVPAVSGERGRSIDIINFSTRQAIEIDGVQHFQKSWMHKDKEDFFKQLKRDDFKENWAKLNGLLFYRIYESDELNNKLLRELEII